MKESSSCLRRKRNLIFGAYVYIFIFPCKIWNTLLQARITCCVNTPALFLVWRQHVSISVWIRFRKYNDFQQLPWTVLYTSTANNHTSFDSHRYAFVITSWVQRKGMKTCLAVGSNTNQSPENRCRNIMHTVNSPLEKYMLMPKKSKLWEEMDLFPLTSTRWRFPTAYYFTFSKSERVGSQKV